MSESTGTAAAPRGGSSRLAGTDKLGPIGRLVLFVRQVVAELRKVIWPNRQELITYTTVVLFFVGIMMAIVALFDFTFTKAVLAVFGK